VAKVGMGIDVKKAHARIAFDGCSRGAERHGMITTEDPWNLAVGETIPSPPVYELVQLFTRGVYALNGRSVAVAGQLGVAAGR